MASNKATLTITAVDRTKAAFQSLNKNLAGTGRQITRLGTATAAGFAALTIAINKAAGEINKFADTANLLGATTEGLQKIVQAGEEVGVTFEQTATSLQRLTRRGQEALAGNQQLADAFASFGISLGELARMTPDQLFEQMAEGLDAARESGRDLSNAMKVLDSEGIKLLRTMDQLQDPGFQQWWSENAAVLEDDAFAAAQKTREEFARLQQVLSVELQQAIIDAEPVITGLAKAFGVAARAAGNLADQFSEENRLRRQIAGLEEDITELQTDIEDLQGGDIFGRSNLDEVNQKTTEQLALMDQLIEKRNRLKEIEEEQAAAEEERRNNADQGGVGGGAPPGESFEDVLARHEAEKQMTEEKIAYEQLLTEVMINEIERRRDASIEEAQEVVDANEARAKSYSDSINAFARAGNAFAAHSKKMQKINKALRVASAIQDTYAGANRALAEHKAPYSFAIAAAVIATGMANVASILSESRGGGGGAGGAAASAPPAETAEPVRQAPLINVSLGGGFYSDSDIRNLIDSINEVAEDGSPGLSGRFIVEGAT